MKVGFIGLGVMGLPMAGHLSRQGHETIVYNRTSAKAEYWLENYKGQIARTPQEVGENATIVCLCVGKDQDVEDMLLGGHGVVTGAAKPQVIVDHTTTSAECSRTMAAACRELGVFYLDAPVSGGERGAVDGCLTVMVGGDAQALEQVRPVLECYSRHIGYFGASGSGQLCKMVNQICIAGTLLGLSEGILLSKAVGLDVAKVKDTIQHGAAGSWQLVNRAETMAKDEFDFGFAIDHMRKDLGFCLQTMAQQGVPAETTQRVDALYGMLQKAGYQGMDTSALIKAVEQHGNKPAAV